jgi:hypothetical protein
MRSKNYDKESDECIASDGGALRPDRWNLGTTAGLLYTAQDTNPPAKHSCKGKNSCKGTGGCSTGDQGCKGKNSCKGKGGCATDGSKPPKAV